MIYYSLFMVINQKSKNGFTLVELSIVIVIVGLIIAGVTSGNVLVKQAKLRTVISQFNEYTAAMNSFKSSIMDCRVI